MSVVFLLNLFSWTEDWTLPEWRESFRTALCAHGFIAGSLDVEVDLVLQKQDITPVLKDSLQVAKRDKYD